MIEGLKENSSLEKVILVSVRTPDISEAQVEEYLDELEFLAETAGAIPVKRFTQNLAMPDSKTFVGRGKLEEIHNYIKIHEIDTIIFDEVDVLSDQLFEQLNDYGRVKIINVGENLHQALLSPKYFEKYYLPYYEKRLTQLHEGGIYCHIHVDGDFHDFLPYLSKMSFDGYEALTPIPQGDVTLEEMRDAIGDKVLLDGIPGIYFMPNVPRAELMACVEKLYDYFYPRLVLGASDEVPQGCDSVEAIERVKMVAKWCRVHG